MIGIVVAFEMTERRSDRIERRSVLALNLQSSAGQQ